MATVVSRGLATTSLPVARHTLLLSTNKPSRPNTRFFLSPPLRTPSCTRSRLLHRRLAAVAMTTTSADPPLTASEKEEQVFWERVTAHQKTAARLSEIEESRIVVNQTPSAFLSTNSQRYEGFPYVSFLEYAPDEDGSLIISVSSLAPHRKDLEKNGKCCLLIMKDKLDRSDTYITYMGEAQEVPKGEQKKARDVFLSRHTQAFWVDFGDFTFMRIEPKRIRYASGVVTPFNRTGEFSGEDFKHAKLDSIAQFSAPIANHMNKDHSEETKLIVEKAIGVKVEHAKIIDLDTLGLNVQVVFQAKPIKLRVPFPRPAQDRKDVKALIVEMLQDTNP